MLNQPLFPDTVIRVWMAVAAGAALLLALILAFFLIRRKKKKKRGDQAVEEPITERPEPLPELELANLQGVGSRKNSRTLSASPAWIVMRKTGCSLCCATVWAVWRRGRHDRCGKLPPSWWGSFLGQMTAMCPGWVYQRSARVYQQFRGHGGTTLVAALLKENRLSFWCVGDSDLFLLRENKLYGLNARQEFKNDLILRALDGAFPVEEAFQDPQAGALSEYIGKEEVTCDYTRMPFLLQPEDALLLCSDGVSDTLTLKQIREAMALSSQACCDKLEEEIMAAGKPGQDNYTAIALKYHGKNEEES